MKITKKKLCDLPNCYAVASTTIDGHKDYLFATELDGCCKLVSHSDFSCTDVWTHPGGTMAMKELPGRNGDFLAIQNFWPVFQAEKSTLVWAHRVMNGDASNWEIKALFTLPYIHRIDILQRSGVNYLVATTLCTEKSGPADWSSPGAVYAAVLPEDLNQPMKLQVVKDGLLQNHGYCHLDQDGFGSAMISTASGVFAIDPPERAGGAWNVNTVLDRPVSDIAMCDLDGDGAAELITIEPFHGNQFFVNKKTENGYKTVYQYSKPMEFGHVVWGGKIRGVPTVIGGYRQLEKELFLLQFCGGNYVETVLDQHQGPSNVTVVNEPERDLILTANCGVGEAAVYIIEDEKE